MTWWQQLITYAALGGLYFVWGYLVRMRVEVRRALKARQQFLKDIEDTADRVAKAMGFTPFTKVDPTEIKAGDTVHWHNDDPDTPCATYTAGFNGDAGNQTSGDWYRKDA